MATAREPRARKLSIVFGAYFLVVIGAAFFLSAPVAVYVDPGATRWICAAYVLLGGLLLVGVCLGAVRRWTRLDGRVGELEDAGREAMRVPQADVPKRSPNENLPAGLPSDRDVERLLTELHAIGEAAATGNPLKEPEAQRGPAVEAAELRDARTREMRRLRKVRDAVAATAAGPALGSAVLLGVFTALLPSSDGMLIANLQLNAFVGLAGLGGLVGLVAYAGTAFRQLGRRAA